MRKPRVAVYQYVELSYKAKKTAREEFQAAHQLGARGRNRPAGSFSSTSGSTSSRWTDTPGTGPGSGLASSAKAPVSSLTWAKERPIMSCAPTVTASAEPGRMSLRGRRRALA